MRMPLTIKQDIRRLTHEADRVQKDLEVLEQQNAAWSEKSQQSDITHIMKHFQRLESDISMMLTECMANLHRFIIEWERLRKSINRA
jgi:hypothetical protein